jgi:hypothetical protein
LRTRVLPFVLTLITVFSLASCQKISSTNNLSTTPAGEGFAVYLTANDTPVIQMEALSHIDLGDETLISAADIFSYDWANHEIIVSENRQTKLADFEVPISGKSFIVCLDKNPVYWGAFYNLLLSN